MITNMQAAAQTYRMNQINSASPLDLILITYDALLTSCGQRDLERTTRALSLLRNALDFSYDANIAMGLFRLYQYCAELAREGKFDEAAHIIRELRTTWAQVKSEYETQVATTDVTPVATSSPPGQINA